MSSSTEKECISSTSATSDKYRPFAISKFNSLMGKYNTTNASYWKLGNSFDTLIDYLANIDSSPADPVARVVLQQYPIALANLGGYNGAWFDDLGWWTAATQRATTMPFFSSASKDGLNKIMVACWPGFTGNAPYVWDRRKPGTFDNYRPAVDGGVWNSYWAGTSSEYQGPKGGDPSSGTLAGIQNTVTNTVYLLSAQRLASSYPGASNDAQREFRFLNTWFSTNPNPLWWQRTKLEALVRERVSHFFNGMDALGFQQDWAWTGDQGLMVGALTDRIDLMTVSPDERAALLILIKQLLEGVKTYLTDSNGLLMPYTSTGTVPDGDTGDYATGPGVFWRNVLHVWKNNSDVKAFIYQPEYLKFLQGCADAVATPPSGNDTFDSLTNDLSVLVAATVILP